MKLGLISDTHDNVAATEAAMDHFESEGVKVVLHCGDFIAPPLIPHLDRPDIDIHAVRGNNDGEREGLLNAFESLSGGRLHGRFAELEFDERTIAMLHGEQKPVIEALSSGEYDYVVHGHWHVREKRQVGDTVVVNPGAHFPDVADDSRTVAILETDGGEVEFHRAKP